MNKLHLSPNSIYKSLAALTLSMTAQYAVAAQPATLVDSASFEYGHGDEVWLARVAVQSNWQRRWFDANGTHLSGYWDLSLAQWRASAWRNAPGRHKNITNLGFTPVFRFQRNDGQGWYAEAGIGLNLLSQDYDNNDNRLSTRFQFGDHVGVGYVFDNRWEVGAKIQHFSNGGFKKPNSGENFVVIKASYGY